MSQRDSRLGVVMGGASGEREISKLTGRTMVDTLRRHHLVKPVELLADGRWLVASGFLSGFVETVPPPGGEDERPEGPSTWFSGSPVAPHEAIALLKQDGVDVVVNGLHGPLGEDGAIQGFLRLHGFPCTGPTGTAAAVTMDKCLTKQVLRAAGINTPTFFTVPARVIATGVIPWTEIVERESQRMAFPWVLKPNRLGSSVGIALINDAEQLKQVGTDLVASWPDSAADNDLLVEAAMSGRELSCGVLEIDGVARALPPIEIRPRTSKFFDYRAKYTPGETEEICPAPLPESVTRKVQDLVIEVHRLFGCAPLSRTDLFLTPQGECVVLEINTLPGMTETSLIPLSASREGLTLSDIFLGLVDHALERARAEGTAQVVVATT